MTLCNSDQEDTNLLCHIVTRICMKLPLSIAVYLTMYEFYCFLFLIRMLMYMCWSFIKKRYTYYTYRVSNDLDWKLTTFAPAFQLFRLGCSATIRSKCSEHWTYKPETMTRRWRLMKLKYIFLNLEASIVYIHSKSNSGLLEYFVILEKLIDNMLSFYKDRRCSWCTVRAYG